MIKYICPEECSYGPIVCCLECKKRNTCKEQCSAVYLGDIIKVEECELKIIREEKRLCPRCAENKLSSPLLPKIEMRRGKETTVLFCVICRYYTRLIKREEK